MHAVMRYGFPALFSWRTLTANAFAARTLPCPTPAGVKLAMLSILLRRDGAEKGQEHVRWLAPLSVAWQPPPRMAVRASTVHVWKGDTVGQPLTGTVGMREYIHAPGLSGLALLDVPDERTADTEYALERLRTLGNAESLIQPAEPVQWTGDVPAGFVLLGLGAGDGEVAALLDDLGAEASFDRLSVYRSPGPGTVPRLNVDRRRFLIQLPLRTTRRTADGYVLERLD
jgi:hypothetical protein